ncbi:Similar to Grhpr: Glyoxylate reductase/hydroxypyruvate reductase (Mus musculus), partial [Cotesia congregata]
RQTAVVISGKAIAKEIKDDLKKSVDSWISSGKKRPRLAAILVGNDPASEVYVSRKVKAASSIGILAETIRMTENVSQKDLIKKINDFNLDPDVDGVLVQLPLPKGFDEKEACHAVLPNKDVDGFHSENLGKLSTDSEGFVPATALAVRELILRSGVKTLGKNAVVIGRALDMTTTICHIHTPREELIKLARLADVLVSATGVPGLVTKDMIKPGACVIDVGITRVDTPDGKTKIVGDVDYEEVKKVAGCELIEWKKSTPIPRSELLSMITGVDGVFCLLTDKIDEEVISSAGPQLKVVATMSVGLDHLDLKSLKERNIKVGYTPDVLTDATAELTVALLLATSRRIIEAEKALRAGEWTSWSPTWMCGPGLAGSTVGIVGLGRIGARVAEYLYPFRVSKILYSSRSDKSAAAAFKGQRVPLDQLLAESDFVIVTIAQTPETRGMFNEEAFSKMKKSSIFINVSRGEIVDQDALVKVLKNRGIRAAGLDVMTPEPIPLDHELLKLDNCDVCKPLITFERLDRFDRGWCYSKGLDQT